MAIDPLIKKETDVIRNEQWADKVRSSIANGLDYMSEDVVEIDNRQKSLESDFVAVQQDARSNTPSGAELAVAAGEYNTLGERLDAEEQKVAAQLAQNKLNDEQLRSLVELLQNQLTNMGDISPEPYDTYADLVSANPSHSGVYVVAADGNWYYWNSINSRWQIGGVFKESALGFKTVTPDKTTFLNTERLLPQEKENQYINYLGQIMTTADFNSTDSIKLNLGETIEIKGRGYLTNVAMISTWSDDGKFIKVVAPSIDSTERSYKYTASSDNENVRLSWHDAYPHIIWKYLDIPFLDNYFKNSIEGLDQQINPVKDVVVEVNADKYINYQGVLKTLAGFNYSDPIKLNVGDRIEFKATGYLSTVSMITKCAEDGTVIKPLAVSSGSVEKTYSYSAVENNEFVILSWWNSYPYSAKVKTDFNMIIDSFRDGSISEENLEKLRFLILAVLHIGDSLTDGGHYGNKADGTPSNGQQIAEDYPYYLGKMSGWNTVNAGVNGYTALTWWQNERSKYDYKNFDTVVIWLGTNGGFTDTLSQDTTIGEGETYLDYAATNTGTYCKIIESIKESNPNAHIHLMSLFATSGSMGAEVSNNVINQIAAKYDLNVIDTSHLFPSDLLHPFGNAVHFGKIGNLEVANTVYKALLNHINKNLSNYEVTLI